MVSINLFGTPVKAKPTVWFLIAALWAGVTGWGLRRHPKRGLGRGLLIGFATVILLLLVEFGHAFAHIFSARYAGAPMDEILLSAGMPRTLYWDNDVAPGVHRMRALGGPLFNAVGFLLSVAIYAAVTGKAIARELAAWSAVGHGLLLIMSLAPVPPVDGGTILKWTLVARGRTETAADALVRRIDWGMGILAGMIGAGFVALQMWLAGVIAVSIGVVIIAVAAGKIR